MIGKKLRHLLKTTKRKQIDLARHLDISPSRLSNYLSDKREPDFDMLAEMARFLGVDMNYFSELDFAKSKSGKVSKSMLAEESAAYGSGVGKEAIVKVPFIPINAKKKGINSSFIPLSGVFFDGIKEPDENVIVFEVNGDVPLSVASDGDFLVCSKVSASKLSDGDFLFENGRNAKFFKYYKHDGKILLVNEDNKKEHLTFKNIDELSGYFKILWAIAKA